MFRFKNVCKVCSVEQETTDDNMKEETLFNLTIQFDLNYMETMLAFGLVRTQNKQEININKIWYPTENSFVLLHCFKM